MKWNRFVRALGTVTIVSFVIVIMTPLTNIAGRALALDPDLRQADAIVVLGSGLLSNGALAEESTQRLLWGMRLYKQGLAPLVIMLGPPRRDTAPESTVRARIAVELGIPQEDIVEISNGLTTGEEARVTARLLKSRNLNHVLLVTESLHMRRSKMVFEAAGLTVSPAPSDNFSATARGPLARLQLLRSLLMHSAGIAYYRIAGYI